jgi:hypothetical protein
MGGVLEQFEPKKEEEDRPCLRASARASGIPMALVTGLELATFVGCFCSVAEPSPNGADQRSQGKRSLALGRGRKFPHEPCTGELNCLPCAGFCAALTGLMEFGGLRTQGVAPGLICCAPLVLIRVG